MENAVELMNNEVTETVVTEVVSEGAEIVSKGMSKGTKYGLVGLGIATLVGVGVFVYKKHKKAKLGSNATTDSNGNVVYTVDQEEKSEEE